MTMFIHFFCLRPLSLTIRLNFDISKVAYWFMLLAVHYREEEEEARVALAYLLGQLLRFFRALQTSRVHL